jgi:hypothetical protein
MLMMVMTETTKKSLLLIDSQRWLFCESSWYVEDKGAEVDETPVQD